MNLCKQNILYLIKVNEEEFGIFCDILDLVLRHNY